MNPIDMKAETSILNIVIHIKKPKKNDIPSGCIPFAIVMQGGDLIHDGWTYIGLNTNWEMGKHYIYTIDFSDGAGQDENGKHLTCGKDIKMNVKISNWNENIAMAKSHGAYKPTPRPNSADSVNSPSDHRENPLSN